MIHYRNSENKFKLQTLMSLKLRKHKCCFPATQKSTQNIQL